MKETDYILLLERFLKGETTRQEEERLNEWFRSERSGEELNRYIRQKWDTAADSSLPSDTKERMFRRIQDRLEKATNGKKRNTPFSFRSWLRYVAAVLLLLAAGWGGRLYTRYVERAGSAKEYVVFASKGQKAQAILPDGTRVWLNSDSEITYTNFYGERERIITLDGEAYFEVAKDSLRRFVVKAGEVAVEALGTSFNVKAYEEDQQSVISLFQGKVRATAGENEVFLLPDQAVTYSKHTGQLRKSTLSEAFRTCSWLNNELAFNDEPLSEIALLLNRMYNVQVVFKTEKVKALRFTGVITNNSLDNIIELISLTAPISYTSKGDTLIIDEKTSMPMK